MATLLTTSVPWYDGETKMHQLLRVPYQDNPTVPFLSPGAGLLMKRSPLLAIGALDHDGRPWCSLWGGEEGLATPTSTSNFDIKTPVGKAYEPVVESLLLDSTGSLGKAVSFVAVDLEHRRRVKLFGKITAGSPDVTGEDERIRAAIAHLTVHVDGSLGNCPKYLNAMHIIPAPPNPKLISETPQLQPGAIDLPDRADCFFICSSNGKQGMDTNIRGGSPGFVRLSLNEVSGAVPVYPEYSGNRLYQTLGNLQTNPLAGYVLPDFDIGNALFVTGRTEILIGKDASSVLPRSNIAVRVTVTAAQIVCGGPGQSRNFRHSNNDRKVIDHAVDWPLSIPNIRPGISWPMDARAVYNIVFYDELDIGYSHMMDDDPLSLNDDYIRTFTVSSALGRGLPNGEFEITVRKHGNVTRCLFQTSERAGLEVPLKGFAGDFQLPVQGSGILPFIAGGNGITPLLAQLSVIDINKLRLFWSITVGDIALVSDTFKRFPDLPKSTWMFVTGIDLGRDGFETELGDLEQSGAKAQCRKVESQDLDLSLADEWYFCGGTLKVSVLNWLAGKEVVFDDFS
ncbi:hypothetical protein BDV19DRAFT_392525 [Aspergillus venezuelensis]